ncbi:MAG: protein kinase domain-containing protein [Myxococcota bacterium]
MVSAPDHQPPGGAARGTSGPNSASSEFPDDGLVFGQYRLLRRLSYGGMGEILLAKHEGVGGVSKLLAIKRLLAQHREDKDVVTMFFDEARLQALMRDPHIVQILDMGQIEGHYFIGMEFVEGTSWRRLVHRVQDEAAALHPAHAAEMMVQGCRGLRYAHELCDNQGRPLRLVHRDVNPQNLLITWEGRCKLIDFGIAKSELSGVHTETGTIKGKFAYMSPEQARAEPLDHRSDIFSLGLCLYELLAGENPFRRNNVVQTLGAICEHDPVPLERLRPEAAALSPIVERCLAKDPDQRFADCEELEQALSTLLADGLCGVPPSSLRSELERWFVEEIAEQSTFLRRHGFAPTVSAEAPRGSVGAGDHKYDDGGRTAVVNPPRHQGATAAPPATRELSRAASVAGIQDLDTRLLGEPVPEHRPDVDTHPTARLKLQGAADVPSSRGARREEVAAGAAERHVPAKPRRWPLVSAAGLVLATLVAWSTWPLLQDWVASWRFAHPDSTVTDIVVTTGTAATTEHGVAAALGGGLPDLVADRSPVDNAAVAAAVVTSAVNSTTIEEVPATGAATVAVESGPPLSASADDPDPAPSSTSNPVGVPRAEARVQTPRPTRGQRARRSGERGEIKRAPASEVARVRVEESSEAPSATASALPRGTLTVNAGGPYRISAPGQKGTNVLKVPLVEGEVIDLDISAGPIQVKLRARLRGGAVALSVDTEPWAVVVANNLGKGRTPQRSRVSVGEPLQLLLKNPEAGEMRVTLGYVDAKPE